MTKKETVVNKDGSAVLEAKKQETQLSKFIKYAIIVIAFGFSVFQLYTAATVPLPAVIQRSIHLGFAIALVFLLNPFKLKGDKAGTPLNIARMIFNVIFFAAAVSACIYLATNYFDIAFRAGTLYTIDVVFGCIMTLAVLEGTRRVMGFPMPLIAGIFLLYAFLGQFIPGRVGHGGYSLSRIVNAMYLSTEGIFGTPLGVSATYVAVFVIFGVILQRTGGGDFIFRIANSLLGNVRGSSAKIGVVVSGLFGTISGSVIANVATAGSLTIPMMKREGFTPQFAGAVEAVASAGGMIMPPVMGAAAFIIGEMLGISYWSVAMAAVIPAILYYTALFITADIRAQKLSLLGTSRKNLESSLVVLKDGGAFLIPIILLLLMLGVFKTSAIKAGLYAAIACFIISLFRKTTRLSVKKYLMVLVAGARGLVDVAMACACAGVIVGVFSLTGLGLKLSSFLITLSGGNLLLLLILTMFCCILLGMGVTTTAAYIVLAVLVAPALIQMGVYPLAAHLFILYFAVYANITPPVAVGAYAAAAIADSDPTKTGYTAFRMALPGLLVPYIFVYNPVLLMQGSAIQVIWSCLTAIVGVYFMVTALEGYLHGKLNIIIRIVIFAGSLLMVIPGFYTDIIGIVVLAVIFILRKRIAKKNKQGSSLVSEPDLQA